MNKTQADAISRRCDREEAIRRTLCGAIANHKEVVVVVGKLVRSGKSLAQSPADGANCSLMLRLELLDKAAELLFRRQ